MNYTNVDFEASYGTLEQLPPSDMPEVAFAGRSNVGKSSMLNRLLSRKAIARVSSVPGKTVTINFFTDGEVRLADLPGYGYAKVARSEKQRWAKMMEGYFSSGRDIRLVVLLVDMRHKPTADDMDMLEFLEQSGYNYAVVMTKADKLNKTEYAAQEKLIGDILAHYGVRQAVAFSSQTGQGAEQLRELINSTLGE